MKNQFRVALVGCGAISGNHIGGILAAGERVCALCDIDAQKGSALAEKFGLGDIPVYTDYSEMLRCENPDIVHICTPHYLHAPMAIEALDKDIHVLCEKPLCISYEQLEALRAAEKSSKATLGVCHQNRWKPSMKELKRLTSDGIKGAFGSVVWNRDADYYRSGDWRGSWKEEGGGVMINQALHTLDLLQWICGMPKHVTARIENWHLKDVIEVEDTATARFELENGMPINFFATTGAGTSLPISVQVTLADKRKVCAQNAFLFVDGQLQDTAEDSSKMLGKEVWGSEHALLIADFYRSIREGSHFPLDVEEGGKVIRLILAMYHSFGERISID